MCESVVNRIIMMFVVMGYCYVARNWTKTPKNPKTKSYHA